MRGGQICTFAVRRLTHPIWRKASILCKGMANNDVMMPSEAGKFIASHSKDVKISPQGVNKTAKLVSTQSNINIKNTHYIDK